MLKTRRVSTRQRDCSAITAKRLRPEDKIKMAWEYFIRSGEKKNFDFALFRDSIKKNILKSLT